MPQAPAPLTPRSRTRRPRGVIEVDGLLWKPKPGVTVTAEEFRTAHDTWIAIHEDACWNPWVEQDRADELERAQATWRTWTRAEPDHKVMTKAEVDEWLASWDREFKEKTKRTDAARRVRKREYNPEREAARLRLLEAQAAVAIAICEREKLLSRERFPGMDDSRRARAVQEEQDRIAGWERVIAEVEQLVGDPETVVAIDGSLPSEHREHSLFRFAFRRRQHVERLRESVAILPGKLQEASGREARAKIRDELRKAERELAFWLSIAKLDASDMCSECYSPLGWHLRRGHVLGEHSGPCPAWPTWAARVQKAREMLLSLAEAKDKQPTAPPAPKPQPIAVLKSRTPIEGVIAELTRISAEHPGAEVRRGNANRWEIWPPATPDQQTP